MWEPPKASHTAVGGGWSSEFYTYTHHHWRYSGSTTYTDQRPRESDPRLVRSQIHRRTQRRRPVLHTPIHLQPDPDKLTCTAGHTHSCTHPVVPGHTSKAALTHTHTAMSVNPHSDAQPHLRPPLSHPELLHPGVWDMLGRQRDTQPHTDRHATNT